MSYREILQKEFDRRIERNNAYSLRSFARDIEINSGALSEILRDKRPFPKSKIDTVINKLKLDTKEAQTFRESIELSHVSLRELTKENEPIEIVTNNQLNEESYKIFIEEWEPFAILNLAQINSFTPTQLSQAVQNYFGIDVEKTQFFIQTLMDLNFLIIDQNGIIQREVNTVNTQNDLPSEVIRNSHLNLLELSKSHINDEVGTREFQAVTIKASPKKIAKAKMLIRDFGQKLSTYLEEDEEDEKEIYQLNIQLFSLKKD